MTPQQLEQHTMRRLDALQLELGEAVDHDLLAAVGRHHFERLRRDATITEFIPLLVYRFTREELVYGTADLHNAA